MKKEGLGFLTTWSTAQASSYMPSHVTEKINLAFSTSYEVKTSTNEEQHQASKTSELEGIASKGCQMTFVKYLEWQNLANIAKREICNACSKTILWQFCFSLGYVLEVRLVSQLELVLFLQLLCSWRYKCECVFVSIYNLWCHECCGSRGDSLLIFVYYKQSKAGGWEQDYHTVAAFSTLTCIWWYIL